MSEEEKLSGTQAIYGDGLIAIGYLHSVYIVTFIALIMTIVSICKYRQKKNYLYYMWFFWVIAPPFWFMAEYFCLFKQQGIGTSFEAFKYGQDIASKVWLAVVTALSAYINYKEKN